MPCHCFVKELQRRHHSLYMVATRAPSDFTFSWGFARNLRPDSSGPHTSSSTFVACCSLRLKMGHHFVNIVPGHIEGNLRQSLRCLILRLHWHPPGWRRWRSMRLWANHKALLVMGLSISADFGSKAIKDVVHCCGKTPWDSIWWKIWTRSCMA